jgi:benzoylformate decarboxylase
MQASGSEAILHLLAEAGVRYLFGNPGTTELPLMDALIDHPQIEYVLGLQEIPVMAMADGYAQASGGLGVVNLHTCCGLGNAMGMLYNAYREGTPLLVTAGQQDRRLMVEEPILWGDMVSVARPWTKWSHEIIRVEDVPAVMRRAIQTALTPPTGPVFLSIPIDVQAEVGELDLEPAQPLNTRVRPPAEALRQAADVLRAAKNPIICVGSRVTERDAVAELVRVAERLGAEVLSEAGTTHGRLGFPADHALYGGGLPLWSHDVEDRLHDYDVLLVVGMDVVRQYVFYKPARPIPEHIRMVQIDEDQWQLNKNYPLAAAVLGDTKTSLAELDEVLAERMTAAQREAAHTRAARWADIHEETRDKLRDDVESQRDARPMTPAVMMSSMARVLPDNVAVIEEAVTSTSTMFERLAALKNTSGYFGHRGWALGWGLGLSIGVGLAWPERPVLAVLGEGASMYGIQGLWSAAKYQIPVTFVVANNAQYQILKIGARQMGLPGAKEGRFLGLDLEGPEIDIVGIARSLGIEAETVSEPDQLSDRVAASLAGNVPRLINVPIQRKQPETLGYG